ncbi:MAG: phosphoglucomutase/phosphomannomutase family protein, partial [Ignavibacteriae bacterium]|nr:phosphoglucomutase/phosphomannomutase family protein [Ignavibacteriota bacterium]
YDRIDIVIEQSQKESILNNIKTTNQKQLAGRNVVSKNLTDGFKYILKDGSWLLIRFSGTEPLVRIYSEAGSKELVKRILEDGRTLVLG